MIQSLDELKQILEERELLNTEYFCNPDYVDAIIGISGDDRIIYSWDKMVESLMEQDGLDQSEAADQLDYNTLKTLSFMGAKRPIIQFELF